MVQGTDIRATPVTIIDVVENALGEASSDRVAALGVAELDELADVVNEFYGAWESPALRENELRLYSGGWIAGNFEGEDSRQYLYTSLLYAPSVIVHDPVAEWFDRDRELLQSPPPIRAAQGGMQLMGSEPFLLQGSGYFRFRDDPERSRRHLSGAVRALMELAPLIREGVVVPVPQWQLVRERQAAILTAVRHDVGDEALAELIAGAAEPPARADHIRGGDVTLPGGVVPADALRSVIENPSYFFGKTLAIADATSSRYIPPAAIDAALLEHRLRKVGQELRHRDIDLQVVAGLASADLPFLGSLGAAKIVAIRRNAVVFEDWRRDWKTVVRMIESSPKDGDAFATQARDVIGDVLLPRIHAVQREVSLSEAMRKAARGTVATLVVEAAGLTVGAVAGGPDLSPYQLATVGTSTVGAWLLSSLFGRSPSGTNGILATLIKK